MCLSLSQLKLSTWKLCQTSQVKHSLLLCDALLLVRGYPTLIWSDNGTNFVGANREIKESYCYLKQQQVNGTISEFCSSHSIEWHFILEHGPNFGGLWKAPVKSAKIHLRRIVGDVKLSFEELTTVLTQIEACLNSRPLVYTNSP